tara:strand:- start:5132 stop:6421 length:1290 start_codon:yes stop_codon:yes gene_type:complete
MHFTFEKITEKNEFYNLLKCTDVNPSGISRFTPSPLVIILYRYSQVNPKLHITFSTAPLLSREPYIIATGVAHSPDNWAEAPNGSKTTPFDHLTAQQLNDMQLGKAYLLLDQSHEGYHEEWLWPWFHNTCNKYNIPIQQIIYVTGNMNSQYQYTDWANKNKLLKDIRMHVFPYAHFELAMASMIPYSNLPTAKQQYKHKKQNIKNIKLYDCLQKRPRNHRAWIFCKLYESNLLNSGINTMNEFSYNHAFMEGRYLNKDVFEKVHNLLPMYPPNDSDSSTYKSEDCGQFLIKYNEDIMLQTWISVVSEAHFSDVDTNHTVFLSEKTFKPIACSQPFILYSNKGSLQRLRDLGYKTFHPYIDETYDTLNTFERIDAITNELKRLDSLTPKEKLQWLSDIKLILDYNRTHLESLASNCSLNILNYFRRIFNV